MARRWIPAAVAAAVVAVAAVAAVAVTRDDGEPDASGTPTPATSSADPTPSAEPPSDKPSAEQPAQERALPVYFVGDTVAGPRLFREFHRLPVAGGSDGAAEAVAAALGEPLDPDYRSPWPDGTEVDAVTVADDSTVTVALTGPDSLADRPGGLSAPEAAIALEQLMYTAQGALQVGNRVPVEFRLNGGPVPSLLGVATAEPLAAGAAIDVQAPVWIISPQDGDTVSSPVTVEGRGAFFEATVSWQLLRPGGGVVDQGFATAEEGMTLSPYSFELDAPPGDYVLRVYDADMSGGEAPGENEDTKRLTLR